MNPVRRYVWRNQIRPFDEQSPDKLSGNNHNQSDDSCYRRLRDQEPRQNIDMKIPVMRLAGYWRSAGKVLATTAAKFGGIVEFNSTVDAIHVSPYRFSTRMVPF